MGERQFIPESNMNARGPVTQIQVTPNSMIRYGGSFTKFLFEQNKECHESRNFSNMVVASNGQVPATWGNLSYKSHILPGSILFMLVGGSQESVNTFQTCFVCQL